MLQETKDTFKTVNDTKSSQKNVFGVFKGGKKNDKSKCQCSKKKFKYFCSNKCHLSKPLPVAEDQQQLKSLNLTKTSATSISSSTTPLPTVTMTQPIDSTSVISFLDDDSVDPELTTGSSSKSVSSLSHLAWNNSSGLKLEVSTNGDELNDEEVVSSSNGQDNLEGLTRKKKFTKKFKSIRSFFNNNPMNSEPNDSAYETATEKDFRKKEERQKKTKKTIMVPLSQEDEEYIDIKKFFSIGLPNKNILGISRLQMPAKLVKSHKQYKKQMIRSNKLTKLSEREISHRMFHGTRSATDCRPERLVDQRRPDLCKTGCGVCGIVKEGNRSKYSRYNNRMWFANSSATSQNYCSGTGTAVKVIFVVEVVANSSDSILIVDKDAATIPKYFIAYI